MIDGLLRQFGLTQADVATHGSLEQALTNTLGTRAAADIAINDYVVFLQAGGYAAAEQMLGLNKADFSLLVQRVANEKFNGSSDAIGKAFSAVLQMVTFQQNRGRTYDDVLQSVGYPVPQPI